MSWKSWVPSPKIVEQELLRGVQEIGLSVSVFASDAGAEGEWRDMKEIKGIFNFRDLAQLKRVSVIVGKDENGHLERKWKEVKMYVEEVRDRLLGTFVERVVEQEE
jgi:hypothetical protein